MRVSYRRKRFREECGYLETVMMEGIPDPVRAKMDTGNGTKASMFHVDKLEVKGNDAHWEKNKKKFKSKVLGVSKPSHIGKLTERPIIEHIITFNNKTYKAFFALTVEDSHSELLVNRDLLTTFKVTVNPNKRFVLSDWTERDKLPPGKVDKMKNI